MDTKTERQKLQDFMDTQEGVRWRNASETLKAIEARYPGLPIPAATSAQDSAFNDAEYKTIRGSKEALLCWSYPGVYFELAFNDTCLEWYSRIQDDCHPSTSGGGRVNQFDPNNPWWIVKYVGFLLELLQFRFASRRLDAQP